MAYTEDNNNPFSDWSRLINKSVYCLDGRRLGLLRKISSDYMIVSGGLINLSRYFIPKSIAESVSKRGIRLGISAHEARTQYSYARMKNFISSLELVPEEHIEHRPFYDRFTTLRYTTFLNGLGHDNIVFVAGSFCCCSSNSYVPKDRLDVSRWSRNARKYLIQERHTVCTNL